MQNNDPTPSWLQLNHRRPPDLAAVAAAVARAEEQTSGEIVPMIVRRSACTGHVVALASALLLALTLGLSLLAYDLHWISHPVRFSSIAALAALGLALLLSRSEAVERWLTPAADAAHQVNARAELEFFEAGLNGTAGRTGILLFVSLAEHRAVVLADRAIAEKLPPSTWEEVISLLLRGIKRGDLAQGFVDAVDRCAAILAPHFPLQPDDHNELANRLIVKE